MSTGSRPTHRLTVFNKETQDKGEIGVAWENTDGSFSIRLNRSVVLSERDNWIIKLWPDRQQQQKLQRPATSAAPTNVPADVPNDYSDDDIAF